MIEKYYIIGSNADGPMKYFNAYAYELLEDHRAATTFNSMEDIPIALKEEPNMILCVTIEKAIF